MQEPVSYTHLRAHETSLHLVCRLLLEKTARTASVRLRHPRAAQVRARRGTGAP